MKKDNYRDYIVSAFRFYALNEEPTKERIELMNLTTAERLDLIAVASTMSSLNADCAKAVKDIYFYNPSVKLHKNELCKRVTRFAVKNNLSEVTVWRWLKSARYTCARNRGLNTTVH